MNYEQLLEILLERDTPLTITTNVTESAIRKGLNKAIASTNAGNSLMGIPALDKTVSIKQDGDKFIIELVNTEEAKTGDTRFAPKFQFEIIEDSDSG